MCVVYGAAIDGTIPSVRLGVKRMVYGNAEQRPVSRFYEREQQQAEAHTYVALQQAYISRCLVRDQFSHCGQSFRQEEAHTQENDSKQCRSRAGFRKHRLPEGSLSPLPPPPHGYLITVPQHSTDKGPSPHSSPQTEEPSSHTSHIHPRFLPGR